LSATENLDRVAELENGSGSSREQRKRGWCCLKEVKGAGGGADSRAAASHFVIGLGGAVSGQVAGKSTWRSAVFWKKAYPRRRVRPASRRAQENPVPISFRPRTQAPRPVGTVAG